MRRALLLALVVAALSAAVLTLSFAVSRYNVRGQRIDDSLADFLYMISAYASLALDARSDGPDQARIRYALGRYRATTHREVKDVAARDIARFGAAAVPILARASEPADPFVLEGVARALEHIGGAQTLPLLQDLIRRHRLFENLTRAQLRYQPLSLRNRVVRALGKSRAPEAVDILIDIHGRAQAVNPSWARMIPASIADTGHGAPYLVRRAREAGSASDLDELIWPLARTRDRQAMEFLAGLFARPELALRRTVRDALDQFGGSAAIPAVLGVLEATSDEYLKSWLIHHVLDDRDARGSLDVVVALEPYLTHPALAWNARYALLRIGTLEANAAIGRQLDRIRAEDLIRDMEYASVHALPIVERLLRYPDPRVRRAMLYKLTETYIPGSEPLIAGAASDDDRWVRVAVQEASLFMDRMAFWKGVTDRLPESVGPSLFHAMRPTFFGAPLDHMLPLLRAVHGVGVALSALLALALLFGLVKVVEPYRFDLFSAFLLLEGFVGDFLLLEFGSKPWMLILGATGCHLALLAGVVCQPREHLPGELAGRFERLMGASVWLAMPLLFAFTTPALAHALRFAFHDSAWSLVLLGLFALVTALVVEQWALRWSLAARSEVAEARMAALLWIMLTALLLVAMARWVEHLWQSGRTDEALVTVIAALPLAWLAFGRLHAFKPAPAAAGTLRPVPGGRFDAADLGARVALQPRERAQALWAGRLVKAAIVLATAVAAAVMAGIKGKALSMLLALLIAPIGAAVATLAIALLAPAWVIHLRGGWARVAASRAGMAFSETGWRRRLALPLTLQRRLGAEPFSSDPEQRRGLQPEEIDWIVAVSARQRGAATARGAA